MKVVVVYNSLLPTFPHIRDTIEREAVRLGIVKLSWHKYTPHLPSPTARAVRGADRVVVVGGDGIVREVASHIVGLPVELGIVHAGTGNLLARIIHLPVNDVRRATRVALSGRAKLIDGAMLSVENESGTSEYFFVSWPELVSTQIWRGG